MAEHGNRVPSMSVGLTISSLALLLGLVFSRSCNYHSPVSAESRSSIEAGRERLSLTREDYGFDNYNPDPRISYAGRR